MARLGRIVGRIGHIYPLRRPRIGHIYPLKRLGSHGAECGGEGKAEDKESSERCGR